MALPTGLLSGVMLLEGTVLRKSEWMNEARQGASHRVASDIIRCPILNRKPKWFLSDTKLTEQGFLTVPDRRLLYS